MCVHFSVCSGCRLPLEAAEPPIWTRISQFFKQPIPLIADSANGWRMKAKLAVRGKTGAPAIGLFREGTHDAIEIPNCLVHHPAINQAVKILQEAMIRLKIEPYDEKRNTGHLRYAQFFVCRATQKVQLVLVARDQSVQMLAKSLSESSALWHSIWINIQPDSTNRILSDQWHHCFGPQFLSQQIGRATVAFHPGAFSQANLTLFDQLLDKVSAWVPQNSRALEIYAGAGGISLHLAPLLQSSILIEDNPYAFLSYEQSQKPTSFEYIQGDAKTAIAHLNNADLIIVDPPRKGLDRDLLDAIKETQDKTLVYISCSFESFERDANELLNAGWTTEDAAGYWLFPGTDHVELATQWKKSVS